MARSRNIKPGFFLNDELAEIEPLGRLLFAGLWTMADREGRLDDRPKKIKAAVLPYDNCNVDELLMELKERKFIIRYIVDDKQYIQITNWNKHQNPHYKEVPSEIPPPPERESKKTEVPNIGMSNVDEPQNIDISNINLSLNQDQADVKSSLVQEQLNVNSSLNQRCTLIPDSLNLIPDSLNLIPEEGATSDERAILKIIKGIHNYPFDFKKDLEHIRSLATDFPDIDIEFEVKKWATYKLDKPLNKKSNPRSQLRNWMTKVIEFKKGGVIRAPARKFLGNTGSHSGQNNQKYLEGTGTDWSKEPEYL